jgi:hypothetical protein
MFWTCFIESAVLKPPNCCAFGSPVHACELIDILQESLFEVCIDMSGYMCNNKNNNKNNNNNNNRQSTLSHRLSHFLCVLSHINLLRAVRPAAGPHASHSLHCDSGLLANCLHLPVSNGALLPNL